MSQAMSGPVVDPSFDPMKQAMRIQRGIEELAAGPGLSETSRGAARRAGLAVAAFLDTLRPGYGEDVHPARPSGESGASGALGRILPLDCRIFPVDRRALQLPAGDRDEFPGAA